VDLVVALTEGIVAAVGRGCGLRLVGSFTASGLVWGAHTRADAGFERYEDLQKARFAISRMGSGSHIMAYVEARRRGWDLNALQVVEVGDLEGARQAFAEGRADVFLWEKYTTKPLVDSGEWKRVGECITPWPAFSVAARAGLMEAHPEVIGQVVSAIEEICDDVRRDEAAMVANIAQTFGLQPVDVVAWLDGNAWVPGLYFEASALELVIATLREVGVLPDGLELGPRDVLWPGCVLLRD
jgi:ABC-type nitrate/sulfonate/bicarbonate transport system substrate-binding protein